VEEAEEVEEVEGWMRVPVKVPVWARLYPQEHRPATKTVLPPLRR